MENKSPMTPQELVKKSRELDARLKSNLADPKFIPTPDDTADLEEESWRLRIALAVALEAKIKENEKIAEAYKIQRERSGDVQDEYESENKKLREENERLKQIAYTEASKLKELGKLQSENQKLRTVLENAPCLCSNPDHLEACWKKLWVQVQNACADHARNSDRFREALEKIILIAVDYDGRRNPAGLKEIIDELKAIAKKAFAAESKEK